DDGAVYRRSSSGTVTAMVRGRAHVGGLVAPVDGGLVATGATVSVIDGTGERLLMRADGGWGFNDLNTEAAGNVFVGMHGERPRSTPPDVEASLWRIGVGGEITHCYAGVQLTNGIGV